MSEPKPHHHKDAFSSQDRTAATRTARARITALSLEQLPGFARLDPLQKDGARLALGALKAAVNQNAIGSEHLRSVADFGAANGGSTFPLITITQEAGGTVDAIEKEELWRDKSSWEDEELKATVGALSDIVPSDNIIIEDGIVYLSNPANQRKYSLITAFMLSRSQPFLPLATAASQALTQDGVLLVSSDRTTASKAKQVIEDAGQPLIFIPGEYSDTGIVVPDTFVITQETCTALSNQ
jgi:hypothetical protein